MAASSAPHASPTVSRLALSLSLLASAAGLLLCFKGNLLSRFRASFSGSSTATWGRIQSCLGWIIPGLKAQTQTQATTSKDTKNKRIRVFMDGCFDVLHVGHANAMRQARELGDELVVGVVADEEIRRCKGPPVLSMEERLQLVRAIKWVDHVIEATPYNLTPSFLSHLFSPPLAVDFIVHGDDPCLLPDGSDAYAEAKRQGRFREIKRTEGVSSTDIVARVLQSQQGMPELRSDPAEEGGTAAGVESGAEEASSSGRRGTREGTSGQSFVAAGGGGWEAEGEAREGGHGGEKDATEVFLKSKSTSSSSVAAAAGASSASLSQQEAAAAGAAAARGAEAEAEAEAGEGREAGGEEDEEEDERRKALSLSLSSSSSVGHPPTSLSLSLSSSTIIATAAPLSSFSHFLPTAKRFEQFARPVREATLQKTPRRVVYVDGGFDILHTGHVKFLAAARSLGDFLLVGVHSDELLRSHRGPHHPILSLHERCLSLLACHHVDDVIIGAPFVVDKDLLATFRVSLVACGSTAEARPLLQDSQDPYELPKSMDIFRELSCNDETTTSTIMRRILENQESFRERNGRKLASERAYYDVKFSEACGLPK